MADSKQIFRVMGSTDEFLSCDCCGRTDLKSTLILAVCDREGGPTGQVFHFGRVCGARHAGLSVRELDRLARDADRVAALKSAAERAAVQRAEDDAFMTFVAARSGRPTHFERLQELGGFRQARDLFRSGR